MFGSRTEMRIETLIRKIVIDFRFRRRTAAFGMLRREIGTTNKWQEWAARSQFIIRHIARQSGRLPHKLVWRNRYAGNRHS